MNELIYGKSDLSRIVSIEPGESSAEIFRELGDGTVTSETVPCSHYILFHEKLNDKFAQLKGGQYYRYMMEYSSRVKYEEVLKSCYSKKYPLHVIRDPKEAIMCKDGYTYFKGMKVEDVSVLSFDIETTGLTHDKDSRVLLISNTFRRNGKFTRKLFALDDYPNQQAMLIAWCHWVMDVNPSVIVGHNIYGFDLPYLDFVSNGNGIQLGRDRSDVRFAHRTSQFRKDGSQAYDYTNAYIYGREIVDTFFLSMKYDVAARREYDSYGLKAIIQHETDALKAKKRDEPKKFTSEDAVFLDRLQHGGNRTFYDASQIKNNWNDPKERIKIKAYAIDDADDALILYDLIIPSFFYYTQSVPRSFQAIINTATGSQLNSLMVRAYLQQGHSIALGSEAVPFEGAISFGVPGIHKNVFKIDVASLYPSIIRSNRIFNRSKDPQELFLKLVEYFTKERLVNKELFEQNGITYYKDLSDSQKIVCNSFYGMLGAPKLNYNSPPDAAAVTHIGREILKMAIKYASGSDYMPTLDESGDTTDAA